MSLFESIGHQSAEKARRNRKKHHQPHHAPGNGRGNPHVGKEWNDMDYETARNDRLTGLPTH